ncbi:hypothetical protein [Actinoplanes palleronii]|nr:hypothetical protein [Actinoplanes palleronii]
MARTTFLVELDDGLFADLKAGADALDVSVETYAAVRLEQQARQTGRARRSDAAGGAPWQPPPALVLLTGLAAQAAWRNGGYQYADVTQWVSYAVLEQAQREPRTDAGHPGAAEHEPPAP